jgi:hypothetical protein
VLANAGQTADELEPIAEAAFRTLPLTGSVAS